MPLVTLGTVFLAACVPQAPAVAVPEPGTGSEPRAVRIVTGKPLHMARQNEPSALASKFGGARSGLDDYARLFGAPLVRLDYQRSPVPVLVEEVPSVEAGTWRVQSDGRMETTYKLRRSATWHDGVPLTADDVIFTWRAIMNPELAALDRNPERLIETIEALDQHTLVIRWRETSIYANAYELEPLPRHILEPLLQRDAQSFANAPYWSLEWIGLGPYQLTEWVPGSHLKGRAFTNYVLGTPRIDDIFVHFIVDANQVVARVLAGNLDLTLGSVIRPGEAALLKPQLEARGEGTVLTAPNGVRLGDVQYRDPQPYPARDVRVRRALVHAMDRQLLVDSLHDGISRPADTWLDPEHPAFKAARATMRTYPFDPARALQLLGEAGWVRGSDGMLRNSSGELFDLSLRTTEGVQNVKDVQAIAEFWKTTGINAEIEIIPRSRQNDQEYRAKFAGVATGSPNIDPETATRWQSDEIPSDANRWRGSNRGGYSNAGLDRRVADYFGAIDVSRRTAVLADLVAFVADDLPSLPWYYPMEAYAVRSGLQGVAPTKPGDGWTTANANHWYWER